MKYARFFQSLSPCKPQARLPSHLKICSTNYALNQVHTLFATLNITLAKQMMRALSSES